MKAHLRSIRISPKKVNLVAGLVRRKSVLSALDYLQFLPKGAARPLRQVILSALSNAVNNFKQDKKKLVIKSITVSSGATLHRFRPVSRGRAHPIRKRSSHISVELEVGTTPETTTAKNAKKIIKKASPKS